MCLEEGRGGEVSRHEQQRKRDERDGGKERKRCEKSTVHTIRNSLLPTSVWSGFAAQNLTFGT